MSLARSVVVMTATMVAAACVEEATIAPEVTGEGKGLDFAAVPPTGPTAKLTASDAEAGDAFGFSISVDGDVAVVGAPGDDDAGSASGSAYVFRRTGVRWTQEAKLTADDAVASNLFGCSVSVNGDVILVGAFGPSVLGGADRPGYVFRRTAGSWVQEAKLTGGNARGLRVLDCSVSVKGDLAILGSPDEDDAGDASGSAYVFRYTGASWMQEARITASDGASNDRFGVAVAAGEDLVIIGARGDDDVGSFSGSAYAFRRTGDLWMQEAKLTANDGRAGARFGEALALHGDVVVVGAPSDVTARGAAYLFPAHGRGLDPRG